jgi:SAM-dependent methyltransferase
MTAQAELTPSRSRALDEVATMIAEFFRLEGSVVRSRLRHEYEHPGLEVAAAWRAASPRTPEEITRFYQETDAYVFARFRFEREGLLPAIRVVVEPGALEEASFDVILSIEVLEHLPDPMDAMRLWHLLLRPGGLVLATESFESIGPDYPSHLESNYQFAGRTHRMMEAAGFASTYFNMDPPNYPMEFTKITPGLSGLRAQLGGKVRRAAKTRWNYLRADVRDRVSSSQP